MTRFSLDTLRSLSPRFDLFDPSGRALTGLLERELYPPLPVAGGALVWGFAVLRAAEGLRKKDLACVPLDPADPLDCLACALRLENRAGAYSRAEQARLLVFIEQNGIFDRLPELLPLIADERPAGWIAAVRDYTGLPDVCRGLVDEGLLDLKTAARVRALPPGVFEGLRRDRERFTFSERRSLALFLWEIARRDRLNDAEATALAAGIFSESDPWPRLRALRYPEFTKLLGRFHGLTAGLKAAGVEVQPPPGFEGEEFSFSFTATSKAVYRKKLAALERFEEQVDGLFDLL